MKIVLNEKSLTPNENWMEFRKVRAIIENQDGEFAISREGGKIIFPGGKMDNGEDELTAIKRELKEETGLDFEDEQLEEVLVLETFYDEFYDYRSQSIKPRHTITTYYYTKTDKQINEENQSLTEEEISENFNIFFVNKEKLVQLLSEDHSEMENGRFFDEENQIIMQKVLKYK